jgi:NADH-quinone oxidoreductase subunit M
MMSVELIFGPMLLAPFVYFISRGAEWIAKWIALALFIGLLAISVDMYQALPADGGFLFLGEFLRVPGFDFALTLQVDALSVIMLILTAALSILVVFSSWNEKHQGAYFSLLIFFAGPIFGVFMTTNLLWFFIFWELVLIKSFFLILRISHSPLFVNSYSGFSSTTKFSLFLLNNGDFIGECL